MRPKILLFSGWQTVNIGDIGHTPGTLNQLEEFLPEAQLSVCLTETTPVVTTMLEKRFPSVSFFTGNLDAAGRSHSPELERAFDKADLVIQNSGMHYNRFWPNDAALLRACCLRNKPYGLYGQSFDGFAHAQIPLMKPLLSRASFIYCRDRESLSYLQSLQLSTPRLDFGPDGCFGIDVKDEQRAEHFLANNGLEHKSFLSVTLRTNTPKLSGGNDELNPISPDPELVATDERWAAALREVILHWVRSTGRKVLLAPEMDKEIGHTERLIYRRLPADVRERVVWRSTFWNVDEAASVYAKAHTVLSMEPHSCIIALANGTPSIHYFPEKFGHKAWMFRDLGIPEWLLDIERTPPSEVVGAIDRIDQNYATAESKVQDVSFRVRQAAQKMAEAIRHTLNQEKSEAEQALEPTLTFERILA